MDINNFIQELEQHDTSVKINTPEFINYVSRYKYFLAFGVLGLLSLLWFLFNSFFIIIISAIISLVALYGLALNFEQVKRNKELASKYSLVWKANIKNIRPYIQGVLVGLGYGARIKNCFIGNKNSMFGVYNYSFYTGAGKKTELHSYVVAYFELSKEIPHILLDSKGNNALLSNSLERILDKEYRVSLEGDFDKYFSLYTAYPNPAEALTIISPDVMQTLIKEAPGIDVEIINKRLWLYIPNSAKYSDYAKVLKAGLQILKSANQNLKHYRMKELGQLSKQQHAISNFYSSFKDYGKWLNWAFLIFAVLYVTYIIVT